MPLGNGFYEFEFSSLEDMQWVLEMGPWQLSPGFFIFLDIRVCSIYYEEY